MSFGFVCWADTFSLWDSGDSQIEISEEGIAWQTDIDKFKNADADDYTSLQWMEVENNGTI